MFNKHWSYSAPVIILLGIFTTVWFLVHLPLINYGTESLPIHAAYVGDEQGPINGALHILADKSPLALRDAYNTQYGPLMSVLAIAPVLVDFTEHTVLNKSFSADSYKNAIIWDWSGVLEKGRLIALATSVLAFFAVFLIAKEASGPIWRPWFIGGLAVLLLATNFHFFIYASHFRHWIFVVTILLWQVWFLLQIRKQNGKKWTSWLLMTILSATIFGISYFGIFFLIIWLPTLIEWVIKRDWLPIRNFLIHGVLFFILASLIVVWVPGPFFRAIGIGYGDLTRQGVEEHINEDYGKSLSFTYYFEVAGANNVALLIGLMILIILLWRGRYDFDWVIFTSIGLGMVGYFSFFSLQSHHEPRYILPSIVLLIVMMVFALSSIATQIKNQHKFWYSLVFILICFQLLFHSVHIAKMLGTYAKGGAEQELLSRLEPFLKDADEKIKVIALRDNLFGRPHTKEAYARYAQTFDFSDRGLFVTLQNEAVYPEDRYLLDIDYFSFLHLPPSSAPDLSQYDLIISRHRPNEPDIPNDRDLIDVNMLNHWYPRLWQEQYVLIFLSPSLQQTYEDSF